MWQCVRIPSGLISKALDIDYAWCEEGKIWFLGQKLSYLFCADIDKKEIDIVSEIPYKDFARAREYIQTIKYKNKLICLPSMAKDILIYDLQNSNIKNLIIRGYENVEQLWCKSAGIVDDKIYIVERTNNCIIILDMFEENISDIITIRCLEKDDIVGEQSAIYKGNLYIPIATQQKIVSFDIYTCVFNEHYVKGSICGCRSICHDGRDCWIIGEHYGIVKWNPVTDEMTDVGNISENFNVFSIDWNKKKTNWYAYSDKRMYVADNNYFCWECLCDGKYVWVIPALSDSIIQINVSTMAARLFQFELEYQGEGFECKKDAHEFSVWGVDEEKKLRIISRQRYKVYCIENEKLSYQIEQWNLSEKAAGLLVNKVLDRKMWEDQWVNIETLIFAEAWGLVRGEEAAKSKNIGESIWDIVVKA